MRRRTWAPPRGAEPVIASLSSSSATAWQSWPGPIAAAKPPCTTCRADPMEWNRCACGAVFALCGDHGQRGDAWKLRQEHRKLCRAPGSVGNRPA